MNALFFLGEMTNPRSIFSLDVESAPSISHLLNSDSDCDSYDDSTVLGTMPAEKDAHACISEIEMAHFSAKSTRDEFDLPRCFHGHANSAIRGDTATAELVSAACAGSQEQTNSHVCRKLSLLASESRWSIKSSLGSVLQKVDDFGRKHFHKSVTPKLKRPLSAGCGLSTGQANILQAQLMNSRSDGGDAIDFDVRWEKRFMM